MKKLISMAAALALALSLCVSAFAANSVTDPADVLTVKDSAGTAVTGVVVADTTVEMTQAQAVSLTLADVAGSAAGDTISIVLQKNITVPAGTAFPLTITFAVSGAKAGMKYQGYHWNGSAWEAKTTVVSDGAVTVTFDALSPVAIVLDTAAASPNTGVSNYSGIAVAVALVGVAGACLVARKKHN